MRFIPRYKGEAPDEGRVRELAERMAMPVPLARCLLQRGVDSPEKAEVFFSGGPETLHDPFLLDGMQEAVEVIESCLWEDEPIMVYGDYDVDGTCATSIIVEHLRSLGVSAVEYMIPSRHMEGYGLHRHSIEKMASMGVRLLITVDCGISNVEEVALARSLGMQVVITDHHECPAVLPEADAIINPKLPGQDYPFTGLCGAAVAGKLVEALSGTDAMMESIDLIALATVADLVPLVDENRALVRMGLAAMNGGARPGIAALMEVAGLESGSLNTGHLGFQLAPRINAGGRIELAGKSVTLLTGESRSAVEAIAQELNENNRVRQAIEKQMLSEACVMMETQVDLARDRGIVLWNEKWNSGVLGIVASRLVEMYHRPTVLLGGDGEAFYGSGRSIPGVHLFEVLTACSECFVRYGGHEQAAGMAVTREHLLEFRQKFNAILTDMDDTLFVPARMYDVLLPLEEVTLELARQIRRMEPMGMGNPTPVFLTEGVEMVNTERMGKEGTHFRTLLQKGDAQVAAVAFRQEIPTGDKGGSGHYQVLISPQINEYRGQSRLQAVIQTYQSENRTDDVRTVLHRMQNRMDRSYFSQLLLPAEDAAWEETAVTRKQFWTVLEKRAIGTLLIASSYEAASAFLEDPRFEGVRRSLTVAWGDLRNVSPGQNALLLAPMWESLVLVGYSRILLLDARIGPNTRNFLAKQLHDAHFGVIMEGNDLGMAPYGERAPWNTEAMRSAYAVLRRELRGGSPVGSREGAVQALAQAIQAPVWRTELALGVFAELGLVEVLDGAPFFRIPEEAGRTQLDHSAMWRSICDLAGRAL